MASVGLLDRAGRRRSPATLSGFHQGRVPRNKGLRYPPDPPTVEETIAVMRAAGDGPEAMRLRGVIIVLWRAGLRKGEALALAETDLDRQRGAVLVRAGKGGRRREDGIDRWAWEQLDPWLELRRTPPVGALFCVLRGPTRGRPCAPPAIRGQLHATAVAAGVRRRFAPHHYYGTRTLSRCDARASRSWPYSASWGMPTSGSPPPTRAGSTTPRSSTRSLSGQHRWFPPAQRSPAESGSSLGQSTSVPGTRGPRLRYRHPWSTAFCSQARPAETSRPLPRSGRSLRRRWDGPARAAARTRAIVRASARLAPGPSSPRSVGAHKRPGTGAATATPPTATRDESRRTSVGDASDVDDRQQHGGGTDGSPGSRDRRQTLVGHAGGRAKRRARAGADSAAPRRPADRRRLPSRDPGDDRAA